MNETSSIRETHESELIAYNSSVHLLLRAHPVSAPAKNALVFLRMLSAGIKESFMFYAMG